MEILIFNDSLLYRIDGIDPEFGSVSLVEVQCFYDDEAMVSEVSPVGNLESAPVGEVLTAMGEALSQDCPALQKHRDYYATFPRIRVNVGEGAENVP